MSQFAQAIKQYRNGEWTREQLLSELDRQLIVLRTSPDDLLVILDEEHFAAALPDDVQTAISLRITRWLQQDTVLRNEPPTEGVGAQNEVAKTVLLHASSAVALPQDKGANRVPAVDVGSILQGRFILSEHAGEGGMSRVYKAMDLRRVEAQAQDPYVAVKVLTGTFSHYFDSMQTLHREAHKLQRLTHPNIVRVMDVDRDGQTVFMTMEFLPGESLFRKLIKPGVRGMPRQEAEPIIAVIADALEFAHRVGIVHGDLKPGNVIITNAGDVKVIDFGIARFLARPKEGGAPDQAGQWEKVSAATPQYASPEMLENLQPDPRDDVYALACIAYELLTGEHPFGRETATAARAAKMKVPRRAPLSARQFKAIVRGLRFDRDERTGSAREFIAEFSGKNSSQAKVLLAAGVAIVAVAIVWNLIPHQGKAVRNAPSLTVGQVFRDCPTCPLMRVLPAGNFVQGSLIEASERPEHRVSIAAPIAFATREITVGEFKEFADETKLQTGPCNVYDGDWKERDDIHWNNVEEASTALHPVSCVSWNEAQAYAAWLSKKTSEHYRLPSASEWEYAADAGAAASQLQPKGEDMCGIANVSDQSAGRRYPGWQVLACDDHFAQTAPVGSFSANAFGLYDMMGNVFEWVEDCWNDTLEGAPTDGSARASGDCTQREMRGGSWFTSPAYLRASYRNRFDGGYRSMTVGFRIVREVRP